MRTHQIRHLPVLEGERLVGIVSQRDLHLIETLPGVDQSEVLVEDAMTEQVFVATPDDELAEVLENMHRHKYGAVVATSAGGTVEGIFTTTDAVRVLAELLRRG